MKGSKLRCNLCRSVAGLIILLVFVQCRNDRDISCEYDIDTPCIPESGTEPFERLSDYYLFQGDKKDLLPISTSMPYDLNTPLFSDYMEKSRFIYVGKDRQIEYNDSTVLNFPDGSILVKNFYYTDHSDNENPAQKRILETRLLINFSGTFEPFVYEWNEDQTDAILISSGTERDVSWTDSLGVFRQTRYEIPSVTACRNCHNSDATLVPLGPEVANLNRDYDYAKGRMNQLQKWQQTGILYGLPGGGIPEAPDWDDAENWTPAERARMYLDVNCSSCHNPSGPAGVFGLYLNYEEDDPQRLGILKRPLAAGNACSGFEYDVVPGKPEESCLLHRMNSTEFSVRMPAIGRTTIHEEGVELIREWIRNME